MTLCWSVDGACGEGWGLEEGHADGVKEEMCGLVGRKEGVEGQKARVSRGADRLRLRSERRAAGGAFIRAFLSANPYLNDSLSFSTT